MKKWIIGINISVMLSLMAYLVKLSLFANNSGFFWRAIGFTALFSAVVILIAYKSIHYDESTVIFISGVINVFMFLFVVSATVPIDGIWCLSYGHPLINPQSCGGGVNYQSLIVGMFGMHRQYTPETEGLCNFQYSYNNDTNTCIREQVGFYETEKNGKVVFDSFTLILNLGWILFPIGALFAYAGYLKR